MEDKLKPVAASIAQNAEPTAQKFTDEVLLPNTAEIASRVIISTQLKLLLQCPFHCEHLCMEFADERLCVSCGSLMCMFLGLQIQPLAQRVAREYVVPGSQAVAQKVPS